MDDEEGKKEVIAGSFNQENRRRDGGHEGNGAAKRLEELKTNKNAPWRLFFITSSRSILM